MFVQGSCVERNKLSDLTALILCLALDCETEQYNSRRKKPQMNRKKASTTQFML